MSSAVVKIFSAVTFVVLAGALCMHTAYAAPVVVPEPSSALLVVAVAGPVLFHLRRKR